MYKIDKYAEQKALYLCIDIGIKGVLRLFAVLKGLKYFITGSALSYLRASSNLYVYLKHRPIHKPPALNAELIFAIFLQLERSACESVITN